MLGYIVEEMFRTAMKYVRTWLSLVVTVGSFVVAVGILLILVKHREPSLTMVCFMEKVLIIWRILETPFVAKRSGTSRK